MSLNVTLGQAECGSKTDNIRAMGFDSGHKNNVRNNLLLQSRCGESNPAKQPYYQLCYSIRMI